MLLNYREMCLRFADLERKLGEIDRARAVYAHCSQICDPRVSQKINTDLAPRLKKTFFHAQLNCQSMKFDLHTILKKNQIKFCAYIINAIY